MDDLPSDRPSRSLDVEREYSLRVLCGDGDRGRWSLAAFELTSSRCTLFCNSLIAVFRSVIALTVKKDISSAFASGFGVDSAFISSMLMNFSVASSLRAALTASSKLSGRVWAT
jgi:hypothetical protein